MRFEQRRPKISGGAQEQGGGAGAPGRREHRSATVADFVLAPSAKGDLCGNGAADELIHQVLSAAVRNLQVLRHADVTQGEGDTRNLSGIVTELNSGAWKQAFQVERDGSDLERRDAKSGRAGQLISALIFPDPRYKSIFNGDFTLYVQPAFKKIKGGGLEVHDIVHDPPTKQVIKEMPTGSIPERFLGEAREQLREELEAAREKFDARAKAAIKREHPQLHASYKKIHKDDLTTEEHDIRKKYESLFDSLKGEYCREQDEKVNHLARQLWKLDLEFSPRYKSADGHDIFYKSLLEVRVKDGEVVDRDGPNRPVFGLVRCLSERHLSAGDVVPNDSASDRSQLEQAISDLKTEQRGSGRFQVDRLFHHVLRNHPHYLTAYVSDDSVVKVRPSGRAGQPGEPSDKCYLFTVTARGQLRYEGEIWGVIPRAPKSDGAGPRNA